jgi:hypothetical protein
MNPRFARIERLLKTLCRQQGWEHRLHPDTGRLLRGIARVTENFSLELRPSRASATGITVVVAGTSADLPIPKKWQRSWRKLSGLNDRADARTLIELALTLPAKQAHLERERAAKRAIEERDTEQRRVLTKLARDFEDQTGRALLVFSDGPIEATSDAHRLPPAGPKTLVKHILMDSSVTHFIVEVPTELAAQLYNRITIAIPRRIPND